MQEILDKAIDHKHLFGISMKVSSSNKSWQGSAGNISNNDTFFIASTTKLYTAAIILKLKEENKLNLDDKIAKYLSSEIMDKLHVYNGVEYSADITIKQLLGHTSGLPDYLEDKTPTKMSLKETLLLGDDKAWSFDNIIKNVKLMKAHFKPHSKGKAYYSDTNYQLLGKIIENITEKSISDTFKTYLFIPLKLNHTYLYDGREDNKVIPLYYKEKPLHIPYAMQSFGVDGGIISTSEDMMVFLKAFFKGELFSKENITLLSQWNKGFFPIEFGTGLMRFKLPWILSFFNPIPELIGHAGLSGAFAFYAPKKDIYITGTVNQINKPSTSYKLILKVLNAFIK